MTVENTEKEAIPSFDHLTTEDAKLLGAAINFLMVWVMSGKSAGPIMLKLITEQPHLKLPLIASMALLGINVTADANEREEVIQTSMANIDRLRQLGIAVISQAIKGDVGQDPSALGNPDPTRLANFQRVGTGTKIAKTYPIDLTHEEMHILFHAVDLAEHGREYFEGRGTEDDMAEASAGASKIYNELVAEAGPEKFAYLAMKFDEAHKLARIDDGEVPNDNMGMM